MTKKLQRNPKLWLMALATTTAVAIGYKVYEYIQSNDDTSSTEENGEGNEEKVQKSSRATTTEHSGLPFSLGLTSRDKKYTDKSIALTLSHSILSSKLPLNDMLLNSQNVTFILPPNLNEDDLTFNLSDYNLPSTLINNYKLLKCSNIQGYFTILKNLKPDLLLLCSDDLGISKSMMPKDLSRFIKQIITLDQNKEDIYTKVAPIFVH